MSTLYLEDIAELLTCAGPAAGPLQGRGDDEAALGRHRPGKVVIVDGVVRYAGPASEGPRPHELPGPVTVQSAGGCLVSPGLCDPHTHPIFAGDRSLEFDLRNQGKSQKMTYAELQAAGGGILSTVRATDAASDEALVQRTRDNLLRMLRQGTTRCEAKTGYGLHPQAELRLLRLLTEVAKDHTVSLSPTFLCHVPPPRLSQAERGRFLLDLASALPLAAQRGAEAVDVYCDEGAFTLAETEQLLRAGKAAGLRLRCHAEQFTYTGAARLAAQLGAASVEHLEELHQMDEQDLAQLARGGTIANLLPGAVLTLRLRWPDARRLLDAGVCVALGTDLNPGSSMTVSQPLMMSLACTQMGMTCAEAWCAVTRNAARAIGPSQQQPLSGTLAPGSRGDLVLWEANTYREVCQHLGGSLVKQVYVAGEACFE